MAAEAVADRLPYTPLTAAKSRLAAELVRGLDRSALQWLSGYMAGAAARVDDTADTMPSEVAGSIDAARMTVLYGSQTGNAKRVAEQLAQQAEESGLRVRLLRADAYKMRELAHERLLYVVISTHSAGNAVEPPDDARGFVEFLYGRRAPQLADLRYAVLALGDTSYPDFCAIGRQVDERLQTLGATRLWPRGDADVDIDAVAAPWMRAALDHAADVLTPAGDAAVQPDTHGVVTPLHPQPSPCTRQHPFAAEVLANQRIVADDSDRDVRHVELSLAGSDITYQPGDALGVWPTHESALVDSVLDALELDGAERIDLEGDDAPLRQWLTARRELTILTRPFLAAHAERGGHDELARLLARDADPSWSDALARWQLPDVLRRWPTRWSAADVIAALRPLAPRMYSIASSQEQVGDEVHLLVTVVDYAIDGRPRGGVASRHLSALREGDTVPVFVEANDRFHLPADPARDIILIGPGTGVAPFRAFVQQREEAGASGRQWLFFGNRHRRSDFLYQLEWLRALRDGSLTRLSVAFSRDQKEKVYVQDRLREHGAELWSWLERGAQVYVCGAAERMAPDVHAALLDLVATHGRKSAADADAWLRQALVDGRYARDVY